ncbi:cysteine desulfurase [archaeon]|jgi:cysteine desulfurase|nr:cysteine desulfurase [archaeon]MBT6761989.1 cysteine desulfurase [archaeon]
METNKQIYLDYAASTPTAKEVVEAMQPYYNKVFANPSSVHQAGLDAKYAVNKARKEIAKIISCKETEIIFTASGSESINLAIQGVARANAKGHIITSAAEHSATLKTCQWLEVNGFQVTYLNPNQQGIIEAKQVEQSIQENTILITLLYANNETGVINPIKEIAKIASKYKILFHLDACQATNYLTINAESLGIDLMTINSSKIYGPNGTALLFIKENTQIKPLIFGGSQENNLRAGTHNLPCIIGFEKALKLLEQEKTKESQRLTNLRDLLQELISKDLKDVFLNGHKEKRLPNILNLSFLGIDSETLVHTLSSQNLCVSNGSACSAGTIKSSHVLESMGLNEFRSTSSIRFSLGKQTTEKEIKQAAEIVIRSVNALRKVSQ